MCILCVIQKCSRKVATMLPWLVIPLIGLWALSQLLPPAFRFEITSPRVACVFVLLVTLCWYELLMPWLSAWRVRRNARLRERKRFEAIEMQKLRKTATRRCRNCLTPYRDQNPGGGKFMCSYCGHISRRPVLDLPVPPGMGASGILKDLVGKSGKILNGKAWADNGWMCGQDWFENGNWTGSPLAGNSSYYPNGGGFSSGSDHFVADKFYLRIFIFACKALTSLFFRVMWLCRKIFRISSSSDDPSADSERRGMLDKRGEIGTSCQESRGEKARRKAEEKRQARLEKELLEEEERKQREEVARLVEERRRLRDEKTEAERERGRVSPCSNEREKKKEAERKRQERKKEKDMGSSKSNSDVEELEKRQGKENERNKKSENDKREQHRTAPESMKAYSADVGNGFKGPSPSSQNKGNAGSRYMDRMRGTFLSSSRAFTGSGLFGKSTNSTTVTREQKSNAFADHAQTSARRKELAQPDRVSGRPVLNGDDKSGKHPVFIEHQPSPAPKKSWQQLFTRSSAVSPPPNSNVISRPNGKNHAEVQSSPFCSHQTSIQSYDNPINFGLPSPFTPPPFTFGSTSPGSTLPLPNEAISPNKIRGASLQLLPEESEIYEDPCYVPDPISLLGPVSESLDNFQLDVGFVTDSRLGTPLAMKKIAAPSEITKPSPIESPLSRSRVSDERHAISFPFPSTPEAQDDSKSVMEAGTWQMWNSSPLGQHGLGLVGGPVSWLVPPEKNVPYKEDIFHPVPQKTMASLFKKDEKISSASHPLQNVLYGNRHNGETFYNSQPAAGDGPWLPKPLFEPASSMDNLNLVKPNEEAAKTGLTHGNPRTGLTHGNPSVPASNHQFELTTANSWARQECTVQGSRDSVGNSPISRPHIGGLYSPPDVQSLWSYD